MNRKYEMINSELMQDDLDASSYGWSGLEDHGGNGGGMLMHPGWEEGNIDTYDFVGDAFYDAKPGDLVVSAVADIRGGKTGYRIDTYRVS